MMDETIAGSLRFEQIVAERVGQRRLMEPLLLTPSARPGEHRAKGVPDLLREGERGTETMTLEGDRQAIYHLDAAVAARIDTADLATIHASATTNDAGDGNTRSRWHALQHPFAMPVAGRSVTIRGLQLKGVVFDSDAPLKEYLGTGWRPEYYFADGDSVLRRYFPCDRDMIGTCDLSEAVREFVYTRRAAALLDPAHCGVPVAIGWGRFPELEPGEFGFVVLGLPELSPRGGRFYEAYDSFLADGDFAPLSAVLHQRARALGYANRRGFAMPFRHYLNTSLALDDGTLFMHDLGDQGAILVEHARTIEQFVAEAFTNLAFAMAPLEHIVDGAPRFMEVRTTIARHLEMFARPTIQGYFDDDPAVSEFCYEDVQRAFRAGFAGPMRENPEPFAKFFRRSLLAALAGSNTAAERVG